MTFSELPDTNSSIKALPEFKLDAYTNVTPSELVVFAVNTLQGNGHYAAIEEIVSACFRLFPHRFSLKNYFYWPDSALIMSYLNEAKEKGDLKGKPADGFAVKVQGRQTVKRVAKVLGVTLPAPEKKKKPAPVKAVVEPVQPAKPKAEKKTAASQKKKSQTPALKEKPAKKKAVTPPEKKPAKPLIKKKSTVPVVMEKPAKKQAPRYAKKVPVKQAKLAKKPSAKKTAPAKAKGLPKPVSVKREILPQIKAESKKKEQAKIMSVPVKQKPEHKKEKPRRQVHVKSAQPAQLTMALTIFEEKKKKPALPVVKKVEPKPVKMEMALAPTTVLHVSKEEKIKAGKVVRVMETSDAYRQYRKNGDKSKISEFDFRSLLLCTMESSAETLARNVRTFKGYANIQNRQDLLTFLNFVEYSFSTLLNSSGKKLAKKR
jgi:hypothetical protein